MVVVFALSTLQAQVAKTPADELFQEATTALQQRDYVKAEFWLRELRMNYPRDERWGPGLVATLDAQNKTQDALKLAQEIQPQFAKSATHSLRIGMLLARLDRVQEALVKYQAALRLSDSSAEKAVAYNLIGGAYLRLDAPDEAVTAFRKAKEIYGKASLQLAIGLSAMGNHEEEITEYRAVLRETPNQSMALNNLAYALAERNQNLDEALSLARRAVDAVPGSSVNLDTLGWVYFKKGMLADAENTMGRALLMEDGNRPTLHRHLVAVLDARAQWTPDRRALRALLETGSTPSEIARMKVLLAKIR